MQKDRIVDGYLFMSEEDANLARQEQKKIDYLEQRLDYGNVQNVRLVYEKATSEKIFKTPIGYDYLRGIRRFLTESGRVEEEQLSPVILHSNYSMKMRQTYEPARKYIEPAGEPKKRDWVKLSVLFNVVLALVVAAMFYITVKSDNPNILNYKTQIVNQYAQWDQELTQRENVVREKERELHINGD